MIIFCESCPRHGSRPWTAPPVAIPLSLTHSVPTRGRMHNEHVTHFPANQSAVNLHIQSRVDTTKRDRADPSWLSARTAGNAASVGGRPKDSAWRPTLNRTQPFVSAFGIYTQRIFFLPAPEGCPLPDGRCCGGRAGLVAAPLFPTASDRRPLPLPSPFPPLPTPPAANAPQLPPSRD